jgi:hypothetical protein
MESKLKQKHLFSYRESSWNALLDGFSTFFFDQTLDQTLLSKLTSLLKNS